jgi:hypothetical protein
METRGYLTINDRTDGWGAGVDENAQPTRDATPEALATRLARDLSARTTGNPTSTPDTDDRSAGYGGAWEEAPVAIGVDYDLEVTGSAVPLDSNDADAASANRSVKAATVSDLVAPGIETVGSIVDRTDGWGHTSGSQSDRKDS